MAIDWLNIPNLYTKAGKDADGQWGAYVSVVMGDDEWLPEVAGDCSFPIIQNPDDIKPDPNWRNTLETRPLGLWRK